MDFSNCVPTFLDLKPVARKHTKLKEKIKPVREALSLKEEGKPGE